MLAEDRPKYENNEFRLWISLGEVIGQKQLWKS